MQTKVKFPTSLAQKIVKCPWFARVGGGELKFPFDRRITAKKALLCFEFSMIETSSKIKGLRYQHTPGFLLGIWIEISLLFPPTALQPFDEGQSRAS